MLRKTACFILVSCLMCPPQVFAQSLPPRVFPGVVENDISRPMRLRYFSYDEATGRFQLYIDKGDQQSADDEITKKTAQKLLEYFLTGVRLPDDRFWVNLRPDAEDSMIDADLAKTDVGRILLEADLQLKKDTARLTAPDTVLGKEYWGRLYKKAEEIYGSVSSIPAFSRPWIVPDEIIIREDANGAYVYKAGLKVMLEQDHLKSAERTFSDERARQLNEYSCQLMRELIIPRVTKEVNSSGKYASLRQVYSALILARWFKSRFRGGAGDCAGAIDKRDLTGLASSNSWSPYQYFDLYRRSFAESEYKAKEIVNGMGGSQKMRSYVSGGIQMAAMRADTFAAAASPEALLSEARMAGFSGTAERLLPVSREVTGLVGRDGGASGSHLAPIPVHITKSYGFRFDYVTSEDQSDSEAGKVFTAEQLAQLESLFGPQQIVSISVMDSFVKDDSDSTSRPQDKEVPPGSIAVWVKLRNGTSVIAGEATGWYNEHVNIADVVFDQRVVIVDREATPLTAVLPVTINKEYGFRFDTVSRKETVQTRAGEVLTDEQMARIETLFGAENVASIIVNDVFVQDTLDHNFQPQDVENGPSFVSISAKLKSGDTVVLGSKTGEYNKENNLTNVSFDGGKLLSPIVPEEIPVKIITRSFPKSAAGMSSFQSNSEAGKVFTFSQLRDLVGWHGLEEVESISVIEDFVEAAEQGMPSSSLQVWVALRAGYDVMAGEIFAGYNEHADVGKMKFDKHPSILARHLTADIFRIPVTIKREYAHRFDTLSLKEESQTVAGEVLSQEQLEAIAKKWGIVNIDHLVIEDVYVEDKADPNLQPQDVEINPGLITVTAHLKSGGRSVLGILSGEYNQKLDVKKVPFDGGNVSSAVLSLPVRINHYHSFRYDTVSSSSKSETTAGKVFSEEQLKKIDPLFNGEIEYIEIYDAFTEDQDPPSYPDSDNTEVLPSSTSIIAHLKNGVEVELGELRGNYDQDIDIEKVPITLYDVLQTAKWMVKNSAGLSPDSHEVTNALRLFEEYLRNYRVGYDIPFGRLMRLERHKTIDEVIKGILNDIGKPLESTIYIKELKGELMTIGNRHHKFQGQPAAVLEAGFAHIFGLRAAKKDGGEKTGVGGIDFRALNYSIQGTGLFNGMRLVVPHMSKEELNRFDIGSELQKIRGLVRARVEPSGERVLYAVAACAQKGGMKIYGGEMLSCVSDIVMLTEENVKPTSKELREALILADTQAAK